MNFEGLETTRVAAIEKTLDLLIKILEDPAIDVDMRLKAAKQIDQISDTMVHAFLISNAVQEDSSTKNKLLKGLDKLHGHGEDDER